MNHGALVAMGAVGAILAVVCCAAPGLVRTFAALGLDGVAGRFGGASTATVVMFVALAGYLAFRSLRVPAGATHNEGTEANDR